MTKIFIWVGLFASSVGFADIKHFAWEQLQFRQSRTWGPTLPAYTLKQKTNHSDPTDTQTFSQRYFFDAKHAKDKNSPVLFYLCGESTCDPRSLDGSIRNHARKHQAYIVALEHRYYGKSQPFKDLSTPNLKYLTTDQAMADAVAFREHVVKSAKLTGKWILVGGSYAGILSSRLRSTHPALFAGALASSAPVRAEELFEQYDHHLFKVVSASCSKAVQKVVDEVEKRLADPVKNKEVKRLFRAEKLTQDVDFLYWVADIAAFAIQYGYQDAFCTALDHSDPVAGYASYAPEIERIFEIDAVKDSPQGAVSENPADYEKGFGMRGWAYQTCNEYGYWQIAYHDRAESMRSARIDLPHHRRVCERLFGIKTPAQTDATNKRSVEPLHLSTTTRIFFTNGAKDPWIGLSLAVENRNTTNAALQYATIADAAHCDDLRAPTIDDNASLRDARSRFSNLISDWLK